MASREGYQLAPGSDEEGSDDNNSNSGSSAKPKAEDNNVKPAFIESCPAVLEPSKDEWHSSEAMKRPKNKLKKLLTHSCPQPSTKVSRSSSGESSSHEDEQNNHEDEQRLNNGYQSTNNAQQTNEPRTSFCTAFMDCYNNYARKIRNSWFIYIFQFFVSLLILSAIVMAIIFFRSCDGVNSSTGPIFTILMGLCGAVLVYKWIAKVCRERSGERYWNREKDRLAICFIFVLFFMGLELLFFRQVTPRTLQLKKEIKCNKIYFYYMYWLHIANAGSLLLGALLYLPDCVSFISNWRHLQPSNANGHYQPL